MISSPWASVHSNGKWQEYQIFLWAESIIAHWGMRTRHIQLHIEDTINLWRTHTTVWIRFVKNKKDTIELWRKIQGSCWIFLVLISSSFSSFVYFGYGIFFMLGCGYWRPYRLLEFDWDMFLFLIMNPWWTLILMCSFFFN